METKKTPVIKEPPVLYDTTQSDIAKLTALLGGPLIAYWNNPRGSVCPDDVVALYAILEKLQNQETIYLFIKSCGGSGQSALAIGAVDRAESLSIMLCKQLLAYHISESAIADRIAEALNSKYPSHTFPILYDEAKRIGLNAAALTPEVNSLLLDLNERYSEMGQRAATDFDESHTHSNEILNIWEATDIQVYYQEDKDWFYRSEERRWIPTNATSMALRH